MAIAQGYRWVRMLALTRVGITRLARHLLWGRTISKNDSTEKKGG